MSRRVFLTIVSIIAMSVGAFALLTPDVLLEQVKMAAPSDAANAMTRTVGILLVAFGALTFLVRNHADSPTLRSVLAANLLLQLGILPLDPFAYATGAFHTVGSFLPNTILHVLLAAGFAHYLLEMRRSTGAPQSGAGGAPRTISSVG